MNARHGSGDSKLCILGTSDENVRERLQAYLDAEFPKRGVHGEHTLIGWATSAIKLGLRVPPELAKTVAENEVKAEEFRQKQTRDALAQAEASAKALREKLGLAAREVQP